MSRPKYGLGILVTCALILASMAITTSSAQASSWTVNGKTVSSTLLPEVQVTSLEKSPGSKLPHVTLTFFLGVDEVSILCTVIGLAGLALYIGGATQAGVALIFAGCQILLNGNPLAACKPRTSGEAAGTIKTAKLKGLLILHEGSGVIQMQPEAGETLAKIELGEECAIGETLLLTGKFTFKDAEIGTELVEHLFQIGPLTELKMSGKKATLTLSITTALSGAHKGLKWSGLPE